jgi:hypothetical protein
MKTTFCKLNVGWNAEPNAPDPRVRIEGTSVVLSFLLNHMVFQNFAPEDVGTLRFDRCSGYRIGSTNEEAWYRGQCRFSKVAPAWGEYYEVSGDLLLEEVPEDWIQIASAPQAPKHFLFYFRDNTFECDAEDWAFSVTAGAAAEWGHAV